MRNGVMGNVGAFAALFRFHQVALFLSRLFEDYDISGCHSKYSFFLHCGDNYSAEALRGHRGLDDVGVLSAGLF